MAPMAKSGWRRSEIVLVIPGLQFHAIAPFSPGLVRNAELAGTSDGRLFAFYAIDQGLSSAIAETDATSASEW
jgi:hypothetical protein